ncbi:MAG TPA: FtsX-like permease family protein [Ktedonobacteraceae bacterium]|nr:FtsX-like permease family protein [Ktedonobacteraceae bacterium]
MSQTISPAREPVDRTNDRLVSTLTLARWRLRQTGWLLLIACLGFVAAMVIACVVPLFTGVATSSGLQSILQSDASRSNITLDAQTQGMSSSIARTVRQQVTPLVTQKLGEYQRGAAFQAIQEDNIQGVAPTSIEHLGYFSIYAPQLDVLKPALRLISGNWPVDDPANLEVVLTSEAAQELHLAVGDQFTLQGDFSFEDIPGGPIDPRTALEARLVGLIEVQKDAPLALHGSTFQPVVAGISKQFTVVTDSTAFLQTLDRLAAQWHSDAIYSYLGFHITWDYLLRTNDLQDNQIDDLTNRLFTVQTAVSNYQNNQHLLQNGGAPSFPYITQTTIYSPQPGSYLLLDLLQQYSNRVALVSIPITILAVQIIALLLFFVSMLVNMLLDRQMAANALLSSRGASSRQIFWSLFMQGLVLCLAGVVLGPLVSILIVLALIANTLPAESVHIARQMISQPLQILGNIGPTAGGTLLAALLTIGLVVRYTSGLNMLTLRRETARTTRAPFWQRYYLDVIAAVVAFSGYGVSLYLASIAHEVDITTQDLILAPLTLVAPIFLLLGCLLLFMRVFPLLLRFSGWLANRRRGATSMLALVQMARAPRQIIRMILLLSLTVAFAIFAQVFSASQTQRIQDIAAYESGADFSGDVANPLSLQKLTLSQVITQYNHIPGVLSASADYTDQGEAVGSSGAQVTIQFRAVDVQSFERTAIWNSQDSEQALPDLLALLPHVSVEQLPDGTQGQLVPALIDQSLANQLHLAVKSTFSTSLDYLGQSALNYRVVAIVAHLPTVNSSTAASSSLSPGGMIVDYQSFASVYINTLKQQLQQNQDAHQGQQTNPLSSFRVPINHIWLSTQDDAGSLASVRAALTAASSKLALTNLYDRRQIAGELQNDPFNLNILIILGIGSLAAFLLALIGNLLSSWLSVRTRRGSFVVLRALGATSRQIAGILLWEQGIIYAGAIVLGLAFGIVLTSVAVPVLVFTGLPAHGPMSNLSISDLYLLQHALPARVIIPFSLDLIFAALVVICLVALFTMVRAALNPSISNELRLNED